jgi:hypothetical protein
VSYGKCTSENEIKNQPLAKSHESEISLSVWFSDFIEKRRSIKPITKAKTEIYGLASQKFLRFGIKRIGIPTKQQIRIVPPIKGRGIITK